MTVTITLTDPTADESRAVRAYLDALHPAPDLSAAFDTVREYSEWVAKESAPLREAAREVAAARSEEDDPQASEPTTTAEDAGAPDRDSAGLPWDERIHASSRATVADGTWRKKRGVAPEEVEAVEREIREDMANALAQDGHTSEAEVLLNNGTPEVPEAPTGESVSAPAADVSSPEPGSADGAEVSDAPPPPPAAPANPFLTVMSRIGKSKLDKARKDELLTAAGALDDNGKPSILVLNKKPELIDGFVALLDSDGV